MESLLIRKLSAEIKAALRQRSALHGHSMEEEARIILATVLTPSSAHTLGWATAFRREFGVGQDPIQDKALKPFDRQHDKDPFEEHRIPQFS